MVPAHRQFLVGGDDLHIQRELGSNMGALGIQRRGWLTVL